MILLITGRAPATESVKLYRGDISSIIQNLPNFIGIELRYTKRF
jgi:hypothetical protein